MNSPLTVKCPTCQASVVWDNEHVYRPFCSERCRLIDLGQWESESYALPVDEPLDEKPDSEDA